MGAPGKAVAFRLLVGLVLILGVLWAPKASAAVYWGNGGPIGVANLDGSSPIFDFSPGLNAGPCGLAVSSSHLYWANWTGVSRVDLNSGGQDRFFIPGTYKSCGVAVDGSRLLWTNRGDGIGQGSIGRASLDGNEVEAKFIDGLAEPCGVASSSEHIYWVGAWGVEVARLDGSEAGPLVPELGGGCAIAAGPAYIYWGDPSSGVISRAKLDGKDVDEEFISNVGYITGVAVNSTHIYWVNRDYPFGSIGVARLDGTEINRNLIMANRPGQEGIALDSRPAAIRPSQISNGISFLKLQRDKRKGTVTLTVSVPERGDLTVTSPAIGWRVFKGPEPPPSRGGIFQWKLKLWPGRTGASSRGIKQRLKRTGRAAFTLHYSFSEAGKFPASGSRKITLVKRKPVKRKQRRK